MTSALGNMSWGIGIFSLVVLFVITFGCVLVLTWPRNRHELDGEPTGSADGDSQHMARQASEAPLTEQRWNVETQDSPALRAQSQRKLPGQGRLTREPDTDERHGGHASAAREDPATAEIDAHPPTALAPAVRPPVPEHPRLRSQPLYPPANQPRETRAERRRRLEAEEERQNRWEP